MAEILQFPEPKGKLLASIDLYGDVDGNISARVRDNPNSVVIRMPGDVFDKLQKLSLWTQLGAINFAEQADALRDPTGRKS